MDRYDIWFVVVFIGICIGAIFWSFHIMHDEFPIEDVVGKKVQSITTGWTYSVIKFTDGTSVTFRSEKTLYISTSKD